MNYDVATPKEYMEALEPDWRKEKLQQVRSMIKRLGPELKEGIEYKMLAYGDDEKSIFQLNAQKNYVSLYIGTIDKVENARASLPEFDMGKGCVRIKKSIVLENTQLEEFIGQVIQIWRDGGETDC